jgi:hypothetical protein
MLDGSALCGVPQSIMHDEMLATAMTR